MARRRARNEGSIFKRVRNGRVMWVGEVVSGVGPTGKCKRQTVYAPTQAKVRDKLKALTTKLRSGLDLDAGKCRLSVFLRQWLSEKAETRKARTVEDYNDLVTRLISPHLGHKRLEVLTPADLRAWHSSLREQGIGARSAQKAHGLLRQALDSAVKDRAIDYNPARSVERPAYRAVRRPVLQPDQVRQLLDAAAGHRLEGMVVLAVLHGLRYGEAAALRWRDVDFRGRELHVVHTLALDKNVAAGWRFEASDHAQDGCLAAPTWPDYSEELARVYLKTHFPHGFK